MKTQLHYSLKNKRFGVTFYPRTVYIDLWAWTLEIYW